MFAKTALGVVEMKWVDDAGADVGVIDEVGCCWGKWLFDMS